ncbi:MAG: hypothetical protein FJX55_09400 [Alphaproteobacteria bacterium]|nr:hypothetical protein [Alphaproteobacteria bacterium]
MSLLGTGAVAIWHDIAPEGRSMFYEWHGSEHMPERLGIPGFRRGRRYVAIDADLEFFNLYEAASDAVLRGDDYRSRLNNPTPWTIETVKHFRSVARSICRVEASKGGAQGGLAATLRYEAPDGDEAMVVDTLREGLSGLLKVPGIAGAHLLIADREASGERTAEQKARGGTNMVPRHILIVEGWGDEKPFLSSVKHGVAALGVTAPGILGFYRLQIVLMPA